LRQIESAWDLPGTAGTVDELPSATCRRALLDDLGIDARPRRALVINHIAGPVGTIEYVFDCGEQLYVHTGEKGWVKSFPLSHVRNVVAADRIDIVESALRAQRFGLTEYLENGCCNPARPPEHPNPDLEHDFYCREVLSGHTEVNIIAETTNVLAYHHTRPAYPVHVVVIPKTHIPSLVTTEPGDAPILLELMGVVRDVAAELERTHGRCRVLTNLGRYQDSKHLHWHVFVSS